MDSDYQSMLEEDLLRSKSKVRIAIFAAISGFALLTAVGFYSFFRIKALENKGVQIALESEASKIQTGEMRNELTLLRNEQAAIPGFIEHVRVGLNWYYENDFDRAVNEYDSAIQLNAKNPAVYNLKGYALLRKGRASEAVEALKNSIELDSRYLWGHYNLALAYWKAGQENAAVDEVSAVISIDSIFKDEVKKDAQFRDFNRSESFRKLIGTTGK